MCICDLGGIIFFMFDYFVFPVNFNDIEQDSLAHNRHRVLSLSPRSSSLILQAATNRSSENWKMWILSSMQITNPSLKPIASIFCTVSSSICCDNAEPSARISKLRVWECWRSCHPRYSTSPSTSWAICKTWIKSAICRNWGWPSRWWFSCVFTSFLPLLWRSKKQPKET